MTDADIRLLNPNTRTCPIFRTRRDAEITKAIYRRVPVLIDANREGPTGNPWGIQFKRMFDQTNDAELFREADTLKADGFKLKGNRWIKGKQVFLPLYEAKMVQAYDHRAATLSTDKSNWLRQGRPRKTSVGSSKSRIPRRSTLVGRSQNNRRTNRISSITFSGLQERNQSDEPENDDRGDHSANGGWKFHPAF